MIINNGGRGAGRKEAAVLRRRYGHEAALAHPHAAGPGRQDRRRLLAAAAVAGDGCDGAGAARRHHAHRCGPTHSTHDNGAAGTRFWLINIR